MQIACTNVSRTEWNVMLYEVLSEIIRATLPTSSGFVLLHANFGPAEGICYTTIVLISPSAIVLFHTPHQQSGIVYH